MTLSLKLLAYSRALFYFFHFKPSESTHACCGQQKLSPEAHVVREGRTVYFLLRIEEERISKVENVFLIFTFL